MMQVEPDPQEEEQLATLKQEYERSKETFESKKTDEAKKEYVEATVAYATATMMAGSLLPKEKYPAALRLYREALEVDPDNETASANKELIEGIYKNNLNRPIPE